jgi:hypothetical protein
MHVDQIRLGTDPDDDLVVASAGRRTSMMRFSKFACEEVYQLISMAVATLALLVATGNFAEAGGSRKERSIESITTRTAGEPIMAIVSLQCFGPSSGCSVTKPFGNISMRSPLRGRAVLAHRGTWRLANYYK